MVALLKRTQFLCMFANTQTLLTLRPGKPSPQQRQVHEGIKKYNLAEITRQRLQLPHQLKKCHSSSPPLWALEGKCQSQISQMCLLNPCSVLSKDLFPAYEVSHAGTIKHNNTHLCMANSHASTSPPTYSSVRETLGWEPECGSNSLTYIYIF